MEGKRPVPVPGDDTSDAESDRNCYTLPDGDCVGGPCMHHPDGPSTQSPGMCLNTATLLLRQEMPKGVEFMVILFHHPSGEIVFDGNVKPTLLWPNLKRIVKKEMKKLVRR